MWKQPQVTWVEVGNEPKSKPARPSSWVTRTHNHSEQQNLDNRSKTIVTLRHGFYLARQSMKYAASYSLPGGCSLTCSSRRGLLYADDPQSFTCLDDLSVSDCQSNCGSFSHTHPSDVSSGGISVHTLLPPLLKSFYYCYIYKWINKYNLLSSFNVAHT